MKIISPLLIILYTCVVSNLNAQKDIPLSGLVVLQNSKFNTGKVIHLSNAEVKAIGASPQLSDVNGKFTLLFPDQPIGNTTRVYATKNGYEVVNKELLQKAAVLGRKSAVKVVMCAEGELYKNQIAYYEIAEDAYLETYKERIALLKTEGKEREVLMTQMQTDFKQEITSTEQANELLWQRFQDARKQAKRLADKWVTINLDDQSESYQEAYRLFLKKDIDGALALLEKINLKERLATNQKEKEKESHLIDTIEARLSTIEQQIEQDINQCLFLANLYQLKYQFDKVEKMFELALKYDPENLDIQGKYADYLCRQNQFDRARPIYLKVLSAYRALVVSNPQSFLPDLSMILNNLGVLQSDENNYEGAKESYKEALKITRKLAKENPNTFLPDLATALSNLGTLQHGENNYEEAKESYKEALKITRKLAKVNPNTFLPDLANVLNNLGVLQYDENNYEGAKESFKKALKITRKLAKENPNTFLPDLAHVLNNLGTLQSDENNYDGAKESYKEALKITRKLAKVNPNTFLPDLADVLNNLGALQYDENNYEGAKESFKEALKIRRKLAKENPNTFLPHLANALNSLGTLQSDENNYEGAKESFKEALKIRRKLAKENPNTFLPHLADVLNNLGALQYNENNYEGAKESFKEALEIYRKLAEENPNTFLPDLADLLNNLGALQSDEKNYEGAKESFKEALKIRRKLAKENPNTFLPYLADVLNNLGTLQSDEKNYEGAKESYKEALEIYRKLAKENPDTFLPDLAMILINMSAFYQKSPSDKTQSLALVEEAIILLIPFRDIPFIQDYLEVAFEILEDWDIDAEAYWQEKLEAYQK